MVTITCDRCGKIYEPLGSLFQNFASIGPGCNRLPESRLLISVVENGVYRNVDLCEDCSNAVYDFVFRNQNMDLSGEDE